MAVHPRCPCTRASLAELARLLAKGPRGSHLHFLVWRGATLPADWEKDGVNEIAARFPAATIYVDDNGREAARFGTATSGPIWSFMARIAVCCSAAGITESRGHEGGNPSQDALLARSAGGERRNCAQHPFLVARSAGLTRQRD